MGILRGLPGNAAEVDIEKLEQGFKGVLVEGAEIVRAFKVLRDIFVFTGKRFVLVGKQGMTANKVDYHIIPYKAIARFSIETAGHFDADSEMKLRVTGSREPIIKELKKGTLHCRHSKDPGTTHPELIRQPVPSTGTFNMINVFS